MVNLNDLNPFALSNATPTGKIVSLRVYPIKSCRGFEVTHTTLHKQGLDLDRQWMFVDASTRKFLTIRDISEMTLVRTSLNADGSQLQVRIEGTKKSIEIPAHPSQEWLQENTKLVPAKVWDAETDGYEYSDAVSGIFSDFFGRQVALIMKGPTPRNLAGNGAPEYLGRTESTKFADVLPILIASECSLSDLNARLQTRNSAPITMERFRPNIIISGPPAWSEDTWSVVRLSPTHPSPLPSIPFLDPSATLTLDVACRCARCLVPNVDPETAEKNKHEPWDTLVSYRRVDAGIKYKPCFGMLCVPRGEGEVAVGMGFEVVERTEEHFYRTGF